MLKPLKENLMVTCGFQWAAQASAPIVFLPPRNVFKILFAVILGCKNEQVKT